MDQRCWQPELLTHDEARRIAANVAKLSDNLRKPTATVRGDYLPGGRYAFAAFMRHHVINAPVKSPVQKPDQAPSVTQNIGSVMSHTSMPLKSRG